ncbi:MAG: glycoside hydrolase family 3 C-terminal domain-containing protein, partial [Deltaproteobacteria bacterium]
MQSHLPQARELVSQLTLEEKALLCVGRDFWTTQPIERLNIPSVWMTDGPHGLRKAATSDAVGIGDSEPATCFPTASALASSWDLGLVEQVGIAMGKEAQARNVQFILGPGVNMKRDPRGGRNFEYFSEDPLLSGNLAAAFINGLQSQGVGASLKHFAVNNQEFARMYYSSELDERTLREIYLPAFEMAIKQSQPWTVMCSYNPVNGVYAAENPYLLHQILKEEWGLEGIVVSDWGAVNDRPAGVDAGMHLEMPSSGSPNVHKVVNAVQAGELDESRLDEIVAELITVILHAHEQRQPEAVFSIAEHHQLARRVASECVTLLKNEGDLLPLSQGSSLAIIGAFAKQPRFQGAGSSQVTTTQIDSAWNILTEEGWQISYASGYELDGATSTALLQEAEEVAAKADMVLLFVGLPGRYESESFDREHIDLPEGHQQLIEAVASANHQTVVVLTNGSAVIMPWVDQVPCVVEAWLGGQAGGSAIVDVLTGKVNPSGKLSETFPKRLEDCPAYLNWPGEQGKVHYREGLFIGYRHYDAKNIDPLFPFGHGLSYTQFAYTNLRLSASELDESEGLQVSVDVTNTGNRAGSEVVQLYVHPKQSRLKRPEQELKGFQKVKLAVGETLTVQMKLTPRDFSYYD